MPEAYPDGRYIPLRREGEPGAVRVFFSEVCHLVDAMCTMAAEMVGLVVGDEVIRDDRDCA